MVEYCSGHENGHEILTKHQKTMVVELPSKRLKPLIYKESCESLLNFDKVVLFKLRRVFLYDKPL